MTSIAFIGLGEAGGLLAEGLSDAGADVTAAYDILIDDAATAPELIAKATELGLVAAIDSAEAVADADVVISAVVSSETVVAARAAGPHMSAGQFYLDINSASPMVKREARDLIEASGAHFVEAAVMDLVPPHGHKVPMFLAGEKAAELVPILAALGMNVEAVGTNIGDASAIKMVRSVFLKGLSAILLECLVAASKVGAEERVLASIQRTYPEIDWVRQADATLSRLTVHAKRQAAEMEEVADTLRDLGVDPFTAEGTGARLGWIADQALLELTEDGTPPKSFAEVLDLLARRTSGSGG